MKRFLVVTLEELKQINPTEAEEWDFEWDNYREFLVDTEHGNKVVFNDGMEPEDACLSRDLRPLVDLLNAVS